MNSIKLNKCASIINEIIALAKHDAQKQYLIIHRNRYIFTLFEIIEFLPPRKFLDICFKKLNSEIFNFIKKVL